MVKKQDNEIWATGKRKSACARVIMKPGEGKVVINAKALEEYFGRPVHPIVVKQPFAATKTENQYDVFVNVHGGGPNGQAEATRHGIARALLLINPEHRKALKEDGLLTRDPRVVERKKYGHKKARRSFQFSKR